MGGNLGTRSCHPSVMRHPVWESLQKQVYTLPNLATPFMRSHHLKHFPLKTVLLHEGHNLSLNILIRLDYFKKKATQLKIEFNPDFLNFSDCQKRIRRRRDCSDGRSGLSGGSGFSWFDQRKWNRSFDRKI